MYVTAHGTASRTALGPSLRTAFLAAIVTCSLGATVARAQSASPIRLGAQVVLGTAAIPVGLGVGLYLGSGFRAEANSNASLVGGAAGVLLAPTAGVMAGGLGASTRGRFLPTLAGSTLGYVATGALLFAEKRKVIRLPRFLTVASLLLPAIGATIAYDRSRH